jgi:hypothetical protein
VAWEVLVRWKSQDSDPWDTWSLQDRERVSTRLPKLSSSLFTVNEDKDPSGDGTTSLEVAEP